MTTRFQPTRADRYKGAALALAVQVVVGYALIVGLGVSVPQVANEGLKLFAVAPPAPPPPRDPPPPQRLEHHRLEGAASPPNIKSRATPVAAPTPVISLPRPPMIVVAPTPAVGNQATSGAAPVAGPGTGAGGVGNGTGSGQGGSGEGDGDYIPPRQIGGSFDRAGYPIDAARAGEQGTVSVRFVVAVDGRVPACVVTRSSGSRALDEATCRIIEQRYRFRPSLDPDGRPVRSQVVEDHEWVLRRDPGDQR